jgi:hypothetical protein
MAKLPRFTLVHDKEARRWHLKNANGSIAKTFARKAAATRSGALEAAVGGRGVVRIYKMNGQIQEERTYPRSADPSVTKGRG